MASLAALRGGKGGVLWWSVQHAVQTLMVTMHTKKAETTPSEPNDWSRRKGFLVAQSFKKENVCKFCSTGVALEPAVWRKHSKMLMVALVTVATGYKGSPQKWKHPSRTL